jgi:hypothetical protein
VSNFVLIALRYLLATLITDRSWTVLLDVKDRQEQIGLMSKPLSAIHHVADVILGPGEDSNTGN